MFACSDATQHEMIGDIQEQRLDGLVVASCSPKLHRYTFRGVATRADLNPYAYTQVNIREQDSWAHGDDEAARPPRPSAWSAPASRAPATPRRSSPSSWRRRPARWSSAAGSPACGRRSAWPTSACASPSSSASPRSGGWVGTFGAMFPHDQDGRDADRRPRGRGRSDGPPITVLTSAEVVGKSGSFGNYRAEVRIGGQGPEPIRALVGSIIVATGFDTYQPEVGEFGYGIDGVLTLPEFKALVDGGPGR